MKEKRSKWFPCFSRLRTEENHSGVFIPVWVRPRHIWRLWAQHGDFHDSASRVVHGLFADKHLWSNHLPLTLPPSPMVRPTGSLQSDRPCRWCHAKLLKQIWKTNSRGISTVSCHLGVHWKTLLRTQRTTWQTPGIPHFTKNYNNRGTHHVINSHTHYRPPILCSVKTASVSYIMCIAILTQLLSAYNGISISIQLWSDSQGKIWNETSITHFDCFQLQMYWDHVLSCTLR